MCDNKSYVLTSLGHKVSDIWSIFILGVSEDVLGWVNCTDRYTDRIKQSCPLQCG